MTSSVTLVHTSDIHLGGGYRGNDNDIETVQSVLDIAKSESADLVLLAGDIFDNNRVSRDLVREIAAMLAGSGREIVILPGNHDCLTSDSVYREPSFLELPNVRILGLTDGESTVFVEWDLEIWGRAHLDYEDMSPLTPAPDRSSARWHVAMAHGHFVRDRYDEERSYLIRSEHLNHLSFDYVALGHWDVWTALDHTGCPAYYCGSPRLAKSVNLVRLDTDAGVQVMRRELLRGLRHCDSCGPLATG